MSEGISLREFGRMIDMSGEGVRKAVNTGRIPSSAVGEIKLKSGRTRPVIIDPEGAIEALGINTDQTQVRDKQSMRRAGQQSARVRSGKAPAEYEEPPERPSGSSGGNNLPSINDSKKITEAYNARIKKIEYEEKAGKLVNKEKVRAEFAPKIIAAKNKLMGIPSKAKTQIPYLTIEDLELLEEMIAEALEEVAMESQ